MKAIYRPPSLDPVHIFDIGLALLRVDVGDPAFDRSDIFAATNFPLFPTRVPPLLLVERCNLVIAVKPDCVVLEEARQQFLHASERLLPFSPLLARAPDVP